MNDFGKLCQSSEIVYPVLRILKNELVLALSGKVKSGFFGELLFEDSSLT